MRKTLTSAIALLALAASPAFANDHEQSATGPIDTVEAFMAVFNAKDGEGMSALVMEGATISVIRVREEAERAAIRPLSGLVEATASAPIDLAEPVWNLRLLEDGPVATVFADYEFLIDGKRSHCGTNVFNLLRIDGEWKISGMSYSDRIERCEGAPAQ